MRVKKQTFCTQNILIGSWYESDGDNLTNDHQVSDDDNRANKDGEK